MTLFDCPTCGKKHQTQRRVEICAGYAKWNEEYAAWRLSFKAGPFSAEGSREKEPYPDSLSSFPGFRDQKRDYYWPVVATAVEQRDELACQDCGTKASRFEVHHIIPRGMGGSDHPANLKLVCKNCHQKYNEKFNGQIISQRARERKVKILQKGMKTLDNIDREYPR